MREALVEIIRLAIGRGATDGEIARVTGYSKNYVGVVRRTAGITSPHTPRPGVHQHLESICARLKAGETLQEVGDSLGVTRERIRQVAKTNGVTGKLGSYRRREIREELFQRKRDERFQGTYGCTYSEVIALNDGLPLSHPESRTLCYRMWVRNVVQTMCSTGTLNFVEWCSIWGEHWNERGRGHGYRISRIDRHKAFTLDNVICERGSEGMSRHRKLNPWMSGFTAAA